MSKFIEYCKIAFFNIKANKVRALLTMLGIIIGISSVVAIVSLGNGFKKTINDELASLAGNTLEVYSMGDFNLTDDDIEALMDKERHILGITPNMILRGEASYKDLKTYSMDVTLGNEILDQSSKYDLIYGRYFTKEECDYCEKVCVLDKSSARKMFGTENAVGMTIDLYYGNRGGTFRIIGIRDDNSSQIADLFMGTGNSDIKVEAPFKSFIDAIGLSGYIEGYYDIVLLLDDSEHSAEVLDHTKAILEARHDVRGEGTILAIDYNMVLQAVSSSLTMVTLLIMLVAAISLFVGGIGVMNIMLVSVTERTREIGIRKALGARTGSILTQFLVESASISLLGGIIGTILGLAGAEFVCLMISTFSTSKLAADFNPIFILGIALFSISIGIVFGIVPARKAAKLSPIEALRHR
ncbi:MAG: ABC transporter permease [Lachnospiraceae bacterium]|nr:ABC transporter permease [Lachnospiraceae bacterium]